MHGAKAEDVIVKVPEGTTLIDHETGLVICDLIHDGDTFIVCHGGRGGRGNKAFATQEDPAPKMSEFGEPGEERIVKCELKVLADVGLVGMPSVGKSTILSLISGANPKIAAYHFTTLNPNLGVVKLRDQRTFVMADLPGLIEGASEGAGLGEKFLKHAMRTRVIAHVLDMGSFEGRDPLEDYKIIRKEVEAYDIKLARKYFKISYLTEFPPDFIFLGKHGVNAVFFQNGSKKSRLGFKHLLFFSIKLQFCLIFCI